MRIQNNITAMNTHRQYTINNDNVAKAAEKLSSGYRINRAGDDAAGLAISEKMRSQIRGLNMATKNSQDAISLVQTAEGALQETHSMLQRMNELAVQAATGTNQEIDRNALAKEFEQLKREINDVAESTTFNNMKILDGSKSYEGYIRSAQTSGITNTAVEMPDPDAAVKPNKVSAGEVKVDTAVAHVDAKFEVDFSGKSIDATNGGGTMKVAGKDITLGDGDGTNAIVNKVKAQIADNSTVTLDDHTYTASWTGNKLTLTCTEDANITVNATTMGYSLAGVSFDTTNGNPTTTFANGVQKQEVNPGADDTWTAQITRENLKVGDKITVDNTDYVVQKDDLVDDASLKAAIETALDGKGANNVDVKLVDGTLTAKIDKADVTAAKIGKSEITFTPNPATAKAATYTNTIEIDTAKMKDGDAFTFKFGDMTTAVTVKFDSKEHFTDVSKTAAERFADSVKDKIGTDAQIEVKGNALVYKGEKVTFAENTDNTGTKSIALVQDKTNWMTEDGTKPNAMRIQVGALENEQLALSIDSMNTAGLGLDSQNLNTQNEAGNAITAVREAINKVSDQRATLGAMQNRLDHKIANLKVSSENLSAAESRIRDVDMASEMTNFTKNNILSQAATAMLAQANSLPQNVLSLLG